LSKFRVAIIIVMMSAVLICEARPGCAGVLTYRGALIDSLNYSASLRVKYEDIRISDAQYRSNFAGLFPEVNISGRAERYENLDHRNDAAINTIGNEVVGGNQSSWRSAFYLSGQYYFSHWYKKRYEVDYYDKLKDSSVHQCEIELKRMIKDVTEIFGGIAEGKIKLQYSDKILQRLYAIYFIKKEAFAAGQFSYEDVLKAESDAINMEKETAKARKDLSEFLERLSNYTGERYSIQNTEIVNLRIAGMPSEVDDTKAIEGMPEFRAQQKQLEAIKAKEKSIGNNYLPDVSLYARYDFYNSSPYSLDSAMNDVRQSAYNVGVMISIPLFDGGVKKWQRKQSFYEIKKQEETVRAAITEKNKDLKTLRAGYTEVSKSYNHYKKLNDQYQKLTDINRRALTLGERSKLDIMDLEKDALTIERDFIIAEHSVAIYEKQIALELDYKNFVSEYDGDWACKY
jgi:outer membrane protein TolC